MFFLRVVSRIIRQRWSLGNFGHCIVGLAGCSTLSFVSAKSPA